MGVPMTEISTTERSIRIERLARRACRLYAETGDKVFLERANKLFHLEAGERLGGHFGDKRPALPGEEARRQECLVNGCRRAVWSKVSMMCSAHHSRKLETGEIDQVRCRVCSQPMVVGARIFKAGDRRPTVCPSCTSHVRSRQEEPTDD
jgi:hypothetical protein